MGRPLLKCQPARVGPVDAEQRNDRGPSQMGVDPDLAYGKDSHLVGAKVGSRLCASRLATFWRSPCALRIASVGLEHRSNSQNRNISPDRV